MTIQKTKKEKIVGYAAKGFLGVIGIAVLGFVGMKVYPMAHGPLISFRSMKDGGSVTNPMIQVSGTALYTKDLVVNGNSLALSPDGSFDEKLVLNPGYNVISVTARDQFGTTSRHDYSVMLNEDGTHPALTMNTASQYAR